MCRGQMMAYAPLFDAVAAPRDALVPSFLNRLEPGDRTCMNVAQIPLKQKATCVEVKPFRLELGQQVFRLLEKGMYHEFANR
ncbi:hypothetical protein CSOJ01_12018 [Colletotrichum sojae]|uniref:Uncharacterized protein n=1 Tax=Colletotrichum sojae TaxID=2175907 RepID=A0A8H6IW19_9PEZI|nr:hypothetical protein CSOJ01_12018 [Colletotrichum sojae]